MNHVQSLMNHYSYSLIISGSTLETLTHWGPATHICVSGLTIIGSDNTLSPGRRQAIIWTNAGILLIWRNKLQWNLKRNSFIFIQENAFEKVVCEMASILSRPLCVNIVRLSWLQTAYDVDRIIVIHPCRCDEYINQSLWLFLSSQEELVFESKGVSTKLIQLQHSLGV